MVNAVDKVLRRYGTQMKLIRGEESVLFRGILHHTGSKSWQNMESVYTPLGEIPRGQYALIAPAGLHLAVGDALWLDGRYYAVRRAETVMYGSSRLYCWGLCVESGGETE